MGKKDKKPEKDEIDYMIWGLLFGPSMGMLYSLIFDTDMGLSMAMGIGIGITIGALFDWYKSKEK